MTLTLNLRGIEQPSTDATAADLPPTLTLTPIKTLRFAAQRGAAAASVSLTAQPDDAVCLRLAGGFEWWMRADEAAQTFGTRQGQRSDASPAFELDPAAVLAAAVARSSPGGRSGRRDGVDVALDSMQVVGIDLAGMTAHQIGEWAEDKALDDQGPGLYRVDMAAAEMMLQKVATVSEDPAQGPILIFIHGTGSSSRGSFSELWDPNDPARIKARQQLAGRYGHRVYALEHRSLTQSPIQNALDLANCLPTGAKVHLVTHSRGGLVGDLLCLGQRQGNALTATVLDDLFQHDRTLAEQWGLGSYNAADYPEQRRMVDQLLTVLDAKHPQVERYVRTACPALGTTLASGKLDRWLSVLRFAGGSVMAGHLIALLLAVIKERTDPRSLPGLESMMPGSALVRMLNLNQLQVDADLTVISGDVEGDSIWGRLKLALPDWFFAGDHDLVVNTGSMYGGVRRVKPGRYFFDQGPTVCHFNYFKNEVTVNQLAAGLIDPSKAPRDFKPLEESMRVEPSRALPAVGKPAGTAPFAIVLPGIMGSHLSEGGERVWFDLGRMENGGIERLAIDRPGVEASDVFHDFYGEFIKFLRDSHTVDVLPYDWRISVRESAKILASLVEQRLAEAERSGQGLHIVAHSMGGLVARAMLQQRPDLWQRLKRLPKPNDFRLMMLGTPNHGSYQAVRLMVGQYRIANLLALLDYRHGRDQLLAIFSRYPGAAELLPWAGVAQNLGDPAVWNALRTAVDESWPLPDKKALDAAIETWNLLRDAPADGECMVYVAGYAGRTACQYAVEQVGTVLTSGVPQIVFKSTSRGDGTVPWNLGLLSGVPTWYAEGVAHDQLLAHSPAFAAYLDLLLTGRTDRLPSSEPAGARGLAPADELQVMPPDVPPLFPTPSDFGGFGSEGSRPSLSASQAATPPVRVSICHGDLAYASHPVCVGHYLGDTQISAERRLDLALDGALSDRMRLGIYPGRLGTWEIFIPGENKVHPQGAIVVGLGQVGFLTPGALSAALCRVLMDYAMVVANWHDNRFGAKPSIRKARVSTLLIGTGAGGFSVEDSVAAILMAVKNANEKLAVHAPQARVLIDELELVEVYEDIALQAARALSVAIPIDEPTGAFIWNERLVKNGTACLRRSASADLPGWWRRLEISHERERGQLHFTTLTDRARAEHTLLTGQIELADAFVSSITDTTHTNEEVSRTLYEMLIPNSLKELAPDRTDLVLLLDEESARFPWEMLNDRWTDAGPLSVAAGLLRQLRCDEFRARPMQTQDNVAYVVGDPRVALPFQQLPGARAEAERVTKALRDNGFRVTTAIDQNQIAIMQGLHADAYRILHLAGHGVHEYELEDTAPPEKCDACLQPLPTIEKIRSGMVIGPNAILTPGDVEQIRWVPELVFINCCHLGVTLTHDHSSFGRLAANLAAQFIRMGVKAVIAAGWAVDDGPACAFAESFYCAMANGRRFGKAVLEARQHVRRAFPQSNTWGAYQCYGDPDYRLHEDGDGNDDDTASYFSPEALVTDLENLASRASVEPVAPQEIKNLIAKIPEKLEEEWCKKSAVATALGLAWGQLECFEEAIIHLDKATQDESAVMSLKALEQRANYKARHAANLAAKGKHSEAIELFSKAEVELKALLGMGPTSERHNLLASLWKRRASAFAEGRLEALANMKSSYVEAARLCPADSTKDAYPKTNSLLADALLGLINGSLTASQRTQIIQGCREVAFKPRQQKSEMPGFWDATAEADAMTVAALAGETLEAEMNDLVGRYRLAFSRGASPREAASVLDQFRFISSILADHPGSAALCETVQKIQDQLERIAPKTQRSD
ncbi:MAG TPA: CHAT domain-containing protein [Rhodocyclaceae bacterium]